MALTDGVYSSLTLRGDDLSRRGDVQGLWKCCEAQHERMECGSMKALISRDPGGPDMLEMVSYPIARRGAARSG